MRSGSADSVLQQTPLNLFVKPQFSSEIQDKSQAFTSLSKVTAHKSWCRAAAVCTVCCDNDSLNSDSRGKKTEENIICRLFTMV